jgi:GMP synthase-like glutamine amidotransferase
MHPTYKIAILDMNAGQPNEGMRCIKMLVEQFFEKDSIEGDYKIFDVRVNHELPELEDFDIFLSSGGPGSPKPIGEKWEKKYFRFLDAIYDHNLLEENKKYLFLICHSFQLACLHWNLAKIKRRKSTAFGIMPVHKTKKGKSEPLLEGLHNPFYAVDSRDYQVLKPKKKKMKNLGCKVLCKEKKRPHVPLERAVMAIRFSREIFGAQFHPEADSEGMMRYFQRADKREHIIKHHGKKKYRDMMEHLDDDDKILKTNRTIIPRFLQEAADAIDHVTTVSV